MASLISDLRSPNLHNLPRQRPPCNDTVPKLSRRQKALLCSGCHANTELMGRYGVDPQAVSSYDQSFHGKKLIRFIKRNRRLQRLPRNHQINVFGQCSPHPNGVLLATKCSACSPAQRSAPEQDLHQVPHAGAHINFCMSGANHMRLKIESSPLLFIEDLFFRV